MHLNTSIENLVSFERYRYPLEFMLRSYTEKFREYFKNFTKTTTKECVLQLPLHLVRAKRTHQYHFPDLGSIFSVKLWKTLKVCKLFKANTEYTRFCCKITILLKSVYLLMIHQRATVTSIKIRSPFLVEFYIYDLAKGCSLDAILWDILQVEDLQFLFPYPLFRSEVPDNTFSIEG